MNGRFLFAMAVAAGSLAAQSVTSEVNKELPSWLRIGGEYRARFEGFLDRGFDAGADDGYFLNRLRINVRIQPVSWMKFVFQGQDSRAFFNQKVPDAAPYANPMDLRLGYVEFGDTDHNPVSVRAGRQELNFGDQRLLGSTPWTNVARSFDAVRLTLRHEGYRLDVFASSVVNPSPTAFDRPQAGNDLHGLYGGIEKLVPDAVIEPYVLWRLAPRQLAESGVTANLDSKTAGVRWVGKIRGAMDYGIEMADQTGALGPDRVRAWAGHWVTGYTLPGHAWRPRFSVEYNYASGDRNPHDGYRGTFDQLYPTGHDKYGVTDQVGWRNIRDFRLGWDAKPARRLTAWTNYHNWWLASARDALYTASGAVLVPKTDGSAGTHVGQEIDLQGMYAISDQMQAGVGIGHIFPGEFLDHTTPGKSYTYPYVMLNYSF